MPKVERAHTSRTVHLPESPTKLYLFAVKEEKRQKRSSGRPERGKREGRRKGGDQRRRGGSKSLVA